MNVVTTNRANCRDCYKCVRSCPMKAIKIVEGHAQVVDEKCIQDGICVKVCPQGAKEIRDDLDTAKRLIGSGVQLMASIAPSFVAAFDHTEPGKIVAALRRLGFNKVQETAFGAELVARAEQQLQKLASKPVISSSCPAVVNLIKKYYPGAIPYLSPIVSPMVAHARMAKKYWGKDLKVVFIGPCVAKKGEMEWGDSVDAVLTFEELIEWLDEEGIIPEELPCEAFDSFKCNSKVREDSSGFARLFPVEGGFLKTAQFGTDSLEEDTLIISGIDSCVEFLKEFVEDGPLRVVEMLGCSGGCINGPGFQWKGDLFTRRRKVLEYSNEEDRAIILPNIFIDDMKSQIKRVESGGDGWLFQRYRDERVILPLPDEVEIRKILAATGKFTRSDELNCGACGYNSCREKAIAVYL
jgi:iron only hydrogenase large subunit-like protein